MKLTLKKILLATLLCSTTTLSYGMEATQEAHQQFMPGQQQQMSQVIQPEQSISFEEYKEEILEQKIKEINIHIDVFQKESFKLKESSLFAERDEDLERVTKLAEEENKKLIKTLVDSMASQNSINELCETLFVTMKYFFMKDLMVLRDNNYSLGKNNYWSFRLFSKSIIFYAKIFLDLVSFVDYNTLKPLLEEDFKKRILEDMNGGFKNTKTLKQFYHIHKKELEKSGIHQVFKRMCDASVDGNSVSEASSNEMWELYRLQNTPLSPSEKFLRLPISTLLSLLLKNKYIINFDTNELNIEKLTKAFADFMCSDHWDFTETKIFKGLYKNLEKQQNIIKNNTKEALRKLSLNKDMSTEEKNNKFAKISNKQKDKMKNSETTINKEMDEFYSTKNQYPELYNLIGSKIPKNEQEYQEVLKIAELSDEKFDEMVEQAEGSDSSIESLTQQMDQLGFGSRAAKEAGEEYQEEEKSSFDDGAQQEEELRLESTATQESRIKPEGGWSTKDKQKHRAKGDRREKLIEKAEVMKSVIQDRAFEAPDLNDEERVVVLQKFPEGIAAKINDLFTKNYQQNKDSATPKVIKEILENLGCQFKKGNTTGSHARVVIPSGLSFQFVSHGSNGDDHYGMNTMNKLKQKINFILYKEFIKIN